jgi:hypothetical protein
VSSVNQVITTWTNASFHCRQQFLVLPSSAGVKNACSYTTTCLYGIVLDQAEEKVPEFLSAQYFIQRKNEFNEIFGL